MQIKWFIFGSVFLGFIHCNYQGSGQSNPFIEKVLEYCPAPGQFINSTYGCLTATQYLVGGSSGMVSLGGCGGYLVVGFEHPVENHPENPYGVDFTVFGNASPDSPEPSTVYVMKDDNQNQLADDTWYLLAGSNYYFPSTLHNYQVTYFNPNSSEAKDVRWIDNLGNEGYILANPFHTQPYYPLNDSFPDISDIKYLLSGMKYQVQIDSTDQAFIVTKPFPFGFADNTPRIASYQGWEPNNPYTVEIEGTGGDSFDISWAVDSEGKSVNLDEIDFIKIQTAVNQELGWLGELSSEISGVLDVAPNSLLTGVTQRLVLEPIYRILNLGETVKLTAYFFEKGIPERDAVIQFSVDNESIATIDANGQLKTLQAGKVKVYAKNNAYSLADSLELSIQQPVLVSSNEVQPFKIYPNPAKDVVHILGVNSINDVRITNLLGQNWELTSENETDYLLPILESGIYVISFRENQLWRSCKLIINF